MTFDWRSRPDKNCVDVDPEVFFPRNNNLRAQKFAKDLCAGCPVIDDCLAFGIETESVGVWGGEFFRDREVRVSAA